MRISDWSSDVCSSDLNGFSTFLLLFYNQVIGLDAGVVGIAIMVALIFDAFVDPVIGELTDRTRSRWGRRLPWLFIAPFPLAFAWKIGRVSCRERVCKYV